MRHGKTQSIVVLLVLMTSSFVLAQQYQLLPKRFLNSRNTWNYTFEVEGEDDEGPFSASGTSYIKVKGNGDQFSGVQTTEIEIKNTVPRSWWDKSILQWRMGSECLEEYECYDADMDRDWNVETVRNNNPFELLPVLINDTDVDRLLGTGEYSGEDEDGETWTGTKTSSVTYIGHETIIVPAGTFDCIHVRVESEWEDDWGFGTSSGRQDYDWWISPTHGIIKMDATDTEGSDEENWSMELTSCKISLPVANEVQRCTVKAGKNNSDSMQFNGTLDATDWDLNRASNIIISLDADDMEDPQEFVFPINENTYKKGKFTGFDGPASLKLDTANGKMTFSAKTVNLTGLACPIDLTITVGTFAAEIELNEEIVNGTRSPAPPELMMGVADSVTVSQIQVRHGRKPGTDSLSAKGFFTISRKNYDAAEPVIVSLNKEDFTVPGSQFTARGDTENCNKGVCEEGPLVKAKFDFAKCTFQIQVTNAVIQSNGNVDFALDVFDNPLPPVPVNVPAPNPARYEIERYRCYNQLGRDWTYDADYTVEIDAHDDLGLDDYDSGSMTGYVSVGNSLLNIDGHPCSQVSASAGDSTIHAAWYEDYYGTHQYTWGNLGGDTLGFEAEMETPLTVPKLLQVGVPFKDSASFTGTYDLGMNPDLDIYDFKGKINLQTTLLGFEAVTVPYNGGTTYNDAAKVQIILTLSGTMKIDYYDPWDGRTYTLRAGFQAMIDQTWWGVEDMGAVKADTTMEMVITLLGQKIEVAVTEYDVLTGYNL